MATLHVYHAGSNTAPYDTWAKAATNLSTAAGAAAAGDTIYVASDHAESAAGQSIAFTNATVAAPINVICGTKDVTSGITALATSGRVTTTTATMTMTGNAVYIYGVEFEGSGAVTVVMRLSYGALTFVYDNCKFIFTSTNSGSSIRTGTDSSIGNNALTRLNNCQIKFAQTANQFYVGGYVEINGGSMISGTSTVAAFFALGGDSRGNYLKVNGFDFSLLGTGFDVVQIALASYASIRNVKMPSGWVGDLWTVVPSNGGGYAELINYGTGDTNYKFWTHYTPGYCKDETTIKRTAGASDGTTAYSIRMTSNANCAFPASVLRSPPIIRRVQPATVVVSVHICHDGASAVTDKECWVELEYLGSSGFPLSLHDSDAAAFNASAAAQPDSQESWDNDTGTGPNGSSTWNQRLLNKEITVAEEGYVIARVCLAKPSWTVYVDPKLEVA